MSRSEEGVLDPLEDFERGFPIFALLTVILAVAASLRQIRRTLVPLDVLSRFAKDMGAGDLEAHAVVDSGDEFEDLGRAFDEMASQIRQQVSALRRLNTIGQALSGQAEVESFLALALEGAEELTGADACALLLGDLEDGFEVVRMRVDGLPVAARSAASRELERVAARVSEERRTLSAARGTSSETTGVVDWDALGDATGGEVGACLVLPLLAERSTSLGALVLISRREDESPFSGDMLDLGESLASQTAAALRQARNVETLRGLFEGLIDLTVRAIDEKSAYTGEHCRKVPILTELIADVACRAEAGPLKDFELTDEQRYELRIAALLHDCGKVVTPVHVMDKATKLETLFDRIEVVRARFEVVRRDIEIALLREQLERAGGSPSAEEIAHRVEARSLGLQEDLAFIEWANRGREFMSSQARARIGSIAENYRWVGPDGVEQPILSDEEVQNLSISRGTLNDEERRIMEDHVVSTINLLEELPFPKELRNVPYIAGAHHEHCDGSGYPKGLSGDQLTMQARILGLADVFEALTAKTRPYKPGMSLSQTLGILREMRDDGHIDARLHDLFLENKVYLRYAVEHLDPQQIDSAHWQDLEELTGGWTPGAGGGDGPETLGSEDR
jgi:HD-GYP domain-containing protein (c-di-GMP phosphodiesterase class II)/HAMP domain-containing protein